MKGSALLETMARQVDEVYEGNLRVARDSARAIDEEAREACDAQETSTIKSTQAEVETLADRWRQKADTEAAKAALVVQNESVCAVLDRVDEEVRTLVAGKAFPAVLDALLEELMAAAPKGVVAIAPPDHVDHVKKWLAGNGHAKTKVEGSADTWDGVAVQDPDRTFRISNTLTGRLSRVEQQARKLCMTALFGGAGSGGGN